MIKFLRDFMSRYTIKIAMRNLWQLFFLYCCVLLYVVFLTPNRYEGVNYHANLIPILLTLKRFHRPAGEHFWIYYLEYWANLFGNIILFIPFGLLLGLILPGRGKRYILLYGFLTSVAIEITQLLLQIGVCDVDDVLLNVAGAAVGIYIYHRLKTKINTPTGSGY